MKRGIILSALLGLVACNGRIPPIPPAPTPAPGQAFDCEDEVANEIRALASTAQAQFQASPTGRYIVTVRRGMRSLQSFQTQFDIQGFVALGAGFAGTMSEDEARRLLDTPAVLKVEPDGVKSIPTPVRQIQGDPGPQADTRLWGLDRIDQRALPLDGDYSPDGSSGGGVHVYIIDTGISPHPDFGDRLGKGASFVGGDSKDGHGHGTHVAGTVGGATFGVAPAVTLHAVRVLNSSGQGTDSGVIQGIEWVQKECEAHGEPCVANMSLGGDTSDALDLALCRLIQSGVFVAVAAGNDGLNACKYSPARVKQALTIMASDRRDNAASFTNIGSCGQCFGPGVDIASTRPGSGEATYSGTSMASPHAAGVAARLLGANPLLKPAELYGLVLEVASKGVIRIPNAVGDVDTALDLLFVGREG